MFGPMISGVQQTTNYRVVLPFYIYASISFLAGTILLLLHTEIFQVHFFNQYTLAITHTMALGWGTMIILGASHQLLPVLIEGKLESNPLAYTTFFFTAIGIPLLVAGFYVFHTDGWVIKSGAVLVNIGVIFYLLNVYSSAFNSTTRNVHAWYILTASFWLFSTTFFGLLLVWNFNTPILPSDSVSYLTLHAHLGIVGWFLLMVIGVGSRLIPMFLISKYVNNKMLWWIFGLVNAGLISFIFLKLWNTPAVYFYFSVALVLAGTVLFGRHCIKAKNVRIRKGIDEQMKTSLLSVLQMFLPIAALLLVLLFLPADRYPNIGLLYGFCIFFGWITAIILGMTFKTLPFIVWNKVYHKRAHAGKTPVPKDLFSERVYHIMLLAYVSGFVVFIFGIIFINQLTLQIGAVCLLAAAALYLFNVGKTYFHQPEKV